MNTKHLKTRILDLALQGKLVENSRISSDLNSRIPSDFNPPFEIPNSWQWVKLGDLGEVILGGTPSTQNENYFGGDIAWVTPADLNENTVYISKGRRNITEEGLKNSSAKLMPKGSVLFSTRAPVGYVAIAENEISTNQGFKSIVLKDFAFNKYIYFVLKSLNNLANSLAGGTTFKELSSTNFKSLPIPLPPLDEQERIVKKIDELFSQIDILETSKQNLLKNIKHTKARILDLALQGKLVENSRIPTDLNSKIPSDFKPAFEIPGSWAWVKLGDICEISSGGTPSRNEAEFWENGTIPWLKIADIKDDYVNSSSEFITQKGLENSSAKIFKKGTLLFTIFATLGEVAILNIDASTNQAIVGLTPKKDNYITKFIFFALKNIKNSVNLIGRGATQKNINQTILKNFYIPLPPLDEQEKIVKKIDELFEILEVIENSL